MAVTPLEGPTTGFAINALEETFMKFGKPKHIITDQGTMFTSAGFGEFLSSACQSVSCSFQYSKSEIEGVMAADIPWQAGPTSCFFPCGVLPLFKISI